MRPGRSTVSIWVVLTHASWSWLEAAWDPAVETAVGCRYLCSLGFVSRTLRCARPGGSWPRRCWSCETESGLPQLLCYPDKKKNKNTFSHITFELVITRKKKKKKMLWCSEQVGQFYAVMFQWFPAADHNKHKLLCHYCRPSAVHWMTHARPKQPTLKWCVRNKLWSEMK